MNALTLLEDAIGYRFNDGALLRQALTHPSCAANHNQRLEFLGDAVLQLCISDALYRARPAKAEGEMTPLRAYWVRSSTLAALAQRLDLGAYLRLSEECARGGGRQRPSILSDAMEALLAAVYLDGGFAAACAVIRRLWGDMEQATSRVQDAKSALQEWCQAHLRSLPEYEMIDIQGPPHQRMFATAVRVDGQKIASGSGQSKQQAQQQAAQAALQLLQQHEGMPPLNE